MRPVDGIKLKDAWLAACELQELFDLLLADGGEAMVAGGAVRNALMGKAAQDVDLSTTLLPEDVMARVEAAGHKTVPTGIDHGTVTVVINGKPFEVTTLREDIETDGRHAVVRFGTDWQTDADRRDLSINALYCDRQGNVFDFVDGYRDIRSGSVRFIGEAGERIREDALRILRFFRFFAWYGDGRPDAGGLKACTANKALLSGLSVERVWMELKKLLAAPDPGRALLWMRTTGILSAILPETEKWGIDAIPGLIELEQDAIWQPDSLLRLMAMIRSHEETVDGLAKRLLLSNDEMTRLIDWARSEAPEAETSTVDLGKLLYRGLAQGITDAMKLEVVHLRNRDEMDRADKMLALAQHAGKWQCPKLPVKGQDLLDAGHQSGPELGRKLAEIEAIWVESGFQLSKQELLGSKTAT